MTWFKVDDKLHSHPKVVTLPLGALGLWTKAGSWCADQLTDGFVPKPMLRVWGATKRQAKELVTAGLWAEVDGGWAFHEWHDHQPTKAQVNARREAERDRKARARRAKGRTESGVPPQDVPAGHDAESRRESVLPDPTRPDPTGTLTCTSAREGPATEVVHEAYIRGWDERHPGIRPPVHSSVWDPLWQELAQSLGSHDELGRLLDAFWADEWCEQTGHKPGALRSERARLLTQGPKRKRGPAPVPTEYDDDDPEEVWAGTA